MARKSKKRSWFRIIRNLFIAIILLVMLLIAAAWIYSRYYGNQLVTDLMKSTVAKSSKGLYRLEMKSLNLNILAGRITIRELELVPDTVFYNKMSETDTLSPMLIHLTMDEFLIRGFNLRKLLIDKELHIRKIAFENPGLTVIIKRPSKKTEKAESSPNMLAIPLPNGLKVLNIQRINLTGGHVTVINQTKSPEEKFEIPSLDLEVRNLLVDSLHRGVRRIFNSDDIRVTVKGFSIKTKNGMYTVIPGEIGLSTQQSAIWVRDLKIKPNYSNYEFSRKLGYQMDRMDISIDRIDIKNLNLRQLILNHKLIARMVMVNGLKMDDFRDKRVPMRPGFYPPLPQQALLRSKMYIKIDHLSLKNGYVKYSEQVGNEPGYVFFDRMEGSIMNLTNDSILVQKHTVMKVNASMRLMGKGQLNAELKIPLGAKNDAFSFSGTLGTMELVEFNAMLTRMIPAEITSGTLKKMVFTNVQADNIRSTGRLGFYYNNFHLKMERSDERTWTKIKTGVLSWAGNAFVKNDNPTANGNFTEGMIFFERDQQKSIFNFLWKSIFSGIKSTVGINKGEQKEMKKEEKKHQKEEKKRERDAKKEARKKK